MDWFINIINQFFVYPLELVPFVVIVLIISFTLHEFAHAYFANRFGDSTAKDQGRLTLNPKVHLDVVGTLLIFIAGFGWAKPVPVRRDRFEKPRMMGVIVSLAGPLSNLLLATIGITMMNLLIQFGLLRNLSEGIELAVVSFFQILISLNLMLFVFNLIPLPPLDGYRIVQDLSPHLLRARVSQYEHWGVVIFLIMVFIPPIRMVTLQPILNLQSDLFQIINTFVRVFLGMTGGV